MNKAHGEMIERTAATLQSSVAMLANRALKQSMRARVGLGLALGLSFDDHENLTEDSTRRLLRFDHPGWRIVAAAAVDPKALRAEITSYARSSGAYGDDVVFNDVVRDVVEALEQTGRANNPFAGSAWVGKLRALLGL